MQNMHNFWFGVPFPLKDLQVDYKLGMSLCSVGEKVLKSSHIPSAKIAKGFNFCE